MPKKYGKNVGGRYGGKTKGMGQEADRSQLSGGGKGGKQVRDSTFSAEEDRIFHEVEHKNTPGDDASGKPRISNI